MIPIDIQVSRSKVKVKGQAYSSYVGEGGHLCFTNSYILLFRSPTPCAMVNLRALCLRNFKLGLGRQSLMRLDILKCQISRSMVKVILYDFCSYAPAGPERSPRGI